MIHKMPEPERREISKLSLRQIIETILIIGVTSQLFSLTVPHLLRDLGVPGWNYHNTLSASDADEKFLEASYQTQAGPNLGWGIEDTGGGIYTTFWETIQPWTEDWRDEHEVWIFAPKNIFQFDSYSVFICNSVSDCKSNAPGGGL